METQQSSDITYRVYDYDRRDAQGNTRELHLDKAIEVTNYSGNSAPSQRVEKQIEDLTQTQLVKETYFSVYHWNLSGAVNNPIKAEYLLISVIDGDGEINVAGQSFPLQKGTNFILPAAVEHYEMKGHAEFIVSHE